MTIIEHEGKKYQRCEVTRSTRTKNQYMSNQRTYGREHLYIVRETRTGWAIYKLMEASDAA